MNALAVQEGYKKFISVFNQLDVKILFHNKFYFMPLHVSSTCASSWLNTEINVKKGKVIPLQARCGPEGG